MTNMHQPDPAALAAVRLRARLRALTAGQTEAFDLLYRHFGVSSPTGARLNQSAGRLAYLAVLLADLAWVHGEHEAHEASRPPSAPETEAVKRVCPVCRQVSSAHRRHAMSDEQRAAVLVYLDALLVAVASCVALDGHAPSRTLGREARRFIGDFTEIRQAAAAL